MTHRTRHLAGALAMMLLLAACSAGSGQASPASPTAAATGPGTGAAASPDMPTSPDMPGSRDPTAVPNPGASGGILDPGGVTGPQGGPLLVTPTANVRDPRDVRATGLEVAVDGRRVTARVSWTSGVEPCYALAGVEVEQTGTTISLTVREGSAGDPGTMCTEQAVFKATVVDLGNLAPGTWTVVAAGDAPPVEITVEG